MPKQTLKKETPMSGVVYDSYNDKTWNFERFFEILADYFDGNPERMAEDIVEALHTFVTNDLNDISKLAIQQNAANLFLLRRAIKGIELEVE
ncbi:MAG: hypothetical protein A2X13_14800 [Bacteroidetes bacterium GWC2_33_15]|nr:MAG: hypothetical protein A2X10_06865 [Bacteroidetes bacterium GWA2_33_15]OFX50142.1 MAG: hypothetical protein A2X13_14800 [Bacteroidetes bacterium GWC2_33_15]OFX65295.1 MAG: hypothetical protein A2X15_04375 [Bacteroidetes bacterium GWB2_32_14]OFX70521.1 MAG: hypothetical protein A2X14_04430 [Bacteroidetes bacterium GWD2_33_33]HAN19606.1 hypothetical protein [Bacteroidales bacterium]